MRRRSVPLLGAAALCLTALILLGLALAWRSSQQARLEEGRLANCQAIEAHKAFHREEAAFDLKETRQVLRDLRIDPDSDVGQRLIERGRKNAARDQARFAPSEC